MIWPETVKFRVDTLLKAFCDRRNRHRPAAAGRVGYEIRGTWATVFEDRPHLTEPDRRVLSRVAQLRYDPASKRWTLYWRRHTGRWMDFDGLRPARSPETLMAEIEKDPTGVFWG